MFYRALYSARPRFLQKFHGVLDHSCTFLQQTCLPLRNLHVAWAVLLETNCAKMFEKQCHNWSHLWLYRISKLVSKKQGFPHLETIVIAFELWSLLINCYWLHSSTNKCRWRVFMVQIWLVRYLILQSHCLCSHRDARHLCSAPSSCISWAKLANTGSSLFEKRMDRAPQRKGIPLF